MTNWTSAQALQAVEDFDDYARMGVPGGVVAAGAYMVLTEYIEQQEAKKAKPDGYVWLDGYHCSHISLVKPKYVTARAFVYVEENV